MSKKICVSVIAAFFLLGGMQKNSWADIIPFRLIQRLPECFIGRDILKAGDGVFGRFAMLVKLWEQKNQSIMSAALILW